jgi:plastocyanin
VIATAAAVVAACGGSNGGTPPPTTAIAKTSANSGDAQSATVGQPLANPIQVVVTENGSPASGVTVTWATTAGGSLTPASGITGVDGIASSGWTLGTTSGAQTASATLTGATGSPVTFTATAVADAATTVAKAGGDEQSGEIGSQLALALQALVTDQHGNGVQGVAVNWEATGGTVSSPSVPTSASGLSSVNVTAGGATGPIVITATAPGLNGSPLTFGATAVPVTPAPATADVTVGNNLFRSNRNSTTNPAVDTVAVDGTVTWTWVSTALTTHSVASEGSPGFTSSALLTGPGETYSFTFLASGTYQYTCAVHPQMTGRIVVR